MNKNAVFAFRQRNINIKRVNRVIHMDDHVAPAIAILLFANK